MNPSKVFQTDKAETIEGLDGPADVVQKTLCLACVLLTEGAYVSTCRDQ
jgi:hypothetical protein